MKSSVYLVFDKLGVREMRKGKPSLAAGQYAVRVTISVPDRMFARMIPEALVEIPEGAIIEPTVEVQVETPAPAGEP